MDLSEITKNYLPACAEIFTETFSQAPWNEEWNTENSMERLSHIYDSKGFCGVFAQDNNVLGFVLGNIEPYFSGPVFYLREMCTTHEYQGNGIGSKLLLELEEKLKLKGVKSIYLLTEHNIPAAQFYTKRGFEIDINTGSFSKILLS